MEQPIAVKCFLCGGTANYAYAYARLSDSEAFLGVIYRGVCEKCLADYIERIKADRHVRADGWVWLAAVLPVGGLLAALATITAWQVIGFGLILLAILLPLGSRLAQRREAKRASAASDEENETRYSELMCLEDALRTNRQIKLVPLHARYCAEGFTAERFSGETGVSRPTAVFLQSITEAALSRIQSTPELRNQANRFDNTHVV
ncbi:MAG: hypothetical protein VB062_04050 [Christensenella sp.]|nr:hypothetical protein [Christensenella sp.]